MKKIDNFAMIAFPSYLLVAIITSSIIIGIFSLSILNTINNSKKEIVRKEIEKIVTEAENMFEYADTGTLVNIDVDFPDTLRFLVFGDIPKNGTNLPKELDLSEETSNNYYYVLDDNTIESFSSNARFSGNRTTNISVLFEGNYNLNLELSNDGDKTYVKIY